MPLVYATVDQSTAPPPRPPLPPHTTAPPPISTPVAPSVPSTVSHPPPLARTQSQPDDKSVEEKKAHAADLVAQIKARLAAKASGQSVPGGNAASPPGVPPQPARASLSGSTGASNPPRHDEIPPPPPAPSGGADYSAPFQPNMQAAAANSKTHVLELRYEMIN
jgi:hypothetical protein